MSKITKSKKSNSNSHLITNLTNFEDEEEDDDNRPFDDFLLREADYIDDTTNVKTNLLKINKNNINNNNNYTQFSFFYALLYFIFIMIFLSLASYALYGKNEKEREFILEGERIDSYLLN